MISTWSEWKRYPRAGRGENIEAPITPGLFEVRFAGTGALHSFEAVENVAQALAQLPVGSYQVTVAVAGFKKYTRSGLTVQVAQTLRIDVTLEVGATSDSVTVTEAGTLLKTESGELSHNVESKSLNELPTLGIGGTLSGSAGIRNP